MARREPGSEDTRANQAVGDASALLSPLRDARAVPATFDKLLAARPEPFPANGFIEVRSALATRAEAHLDPKNARTCSPARQL